MTKTTKSERKWGKKEEDVPKTNKIKDSVEPKVDHYKVLVDGSGFTKSMSYEDCMEEINKYEKKASRLRQPLPSLILVKQ